MLVLTYNISEKVPKKMPNDEIKHFKILAPSRCQKQSIHYTSISHAIKDPQHAEYQFLQKLVSPSIESFFYHSDFYLSSYLSSLSSQCEQ